MSTLKRKIMTLWRLICSQSSSWVWIHLHHCHRIWKASPSLSTSLSSSTRSSTFKLRALAWQLQKWSKMEVWSREISSWLRSTILFKKNNLDFSVQTSQQLSRSWIGDWPCHLRSIHYRLARRKSTRSLQSILKNSSSPSLSGMEMIIWSMVQQGSLCIAY